MFTKDFASENIDKDQSLPPFNLLFEFIRTEGLIGCLLCFLCAQDLQNLRLAIGVKKYLGYEKFLNRLFFGCKEHYLMRTRLEQAQTLRDLLLAWDYEKIEALVKRDPKVVSIVCDYRMNRWQEASTSRRLSAVEYAWLAGDQNFIELFERLSQDHLAPICYQNKASLQTESSEMLRNLAKALSDYADKKIEWDKLELLWYDAPHWVYCLSYFFYVHDIDTPAKVASFDVMSADFRRAVPGSAAKMPIGLYHVAFALDKVHLLAKLALYPSCPHLFWNETICSPWVCSERFESSQSDP